MNSAQRPPHGPRSKRVAILHQGFVPTYRRAFFELLHEAGDIEYVVFHGDPPKDSGLEADPGPFGFTHVRVRNVELRILGRSVVWQPVLRHVLSGRFDGIVVGHEMRLMANGVLFCCFKLLGRPVICWGHGTEIARDVTGPARLPRAMAVVAKRLMARLADAYLVYTPRGRDNLVREGVSADRITPLGNTLDMTEEMALSVKAHEVAACDTREELGLRKDSVVLVYLGRLYSEKRIDELPAAVKMAVERGWIEKPVEIIIVGDGPDAERLNTSWGGAMGARVTGPLPGDELAKYLRVAGGVVIPGKVGLAVNHAFAHGVPVITRGSELHSPEVEYIQHGQNGLIVEGDEEAFARSLAGFVEDVELQSKLAAGARGTCKTLQLPRMVEAFHGAVHVAVAGCEPRAHGASTANR